MSRRDRIQEAIKQETSSIIHDELKDPRLGFVTVTGVEISADLRHAKVFVSVLGQEKANSTFVALESAKGFVRKLLAERLRMRFTPEISFREDKSSEYSVYISKKIDEIKELNNETVQNNEDKEHRKNKRISKKS